MKPMRYVQFSLLSALFVLLVSLSLFVFGMSSLTQETTLKPLLRDTIVDTISQQHVGSLYEQHVEACQLTQTIDVTFFGEDGTLQCDRVDITPKEHYTLLLADDIVFPALYERVYPCTFLHCMTSFETLPVLFSRQGHEFLYNMRYFLLLGTFLLFIILFLLPRNSLKACRALGAELSLLSIGYLIFYWLPLPTFTHTQGELSVQPYIHAFLTPLLIPLALLLAVGVALFLVGFLLRIVQKRKGY